METQSQTTFENILTNSPSEYKNINKTPYEIPKISQLISIQEIVHGGDPTLPTESNGNWDHS